MPYLGISWAGIWRCYCHNWNQCPQVCLITDFGGRIKIPKFGTKMPYFVIFGLRFEKGIVIFEISTLELVLLPKLV